MMIIQPLHRLPLYSSLKTNYSIEFIVFYKVSVKATVESLRETYFMNFFINLILQFFRPRIPAYAYVRVSNDYVKRTEKRSGK